jgi:predicted peptidase
MSYPTTRSLLMSLLVFATTGAMRAAELQTVGSFHRTFNKTIGYQYLLSLPTGYTAAGEKHWPVILFLHGSGERGTDPWLVAVHGPPKLIRGEIAPAGSATAAAVAAAGLTESPDARARREQAAAVLREKFIVISPQCPTGVWWDDDGVLGLLDEVMAKYRTDPHHVYLTGLSMGGFGTWSVAMKHPERFAAIVPICGGGQTRDIIRSSHDNPAYVAALRSLGVRVFHGALDTTVLPEESQRMVDALKKAGVTDLELTIYLDATHDSWTRTYANPELYEWLLKHQR